MRLTAFIAGGLLSFVIFSGTGVKASAQTITGTSLDGVSQTTDKLDVLELVESHAAPAVPVTPAPEPPTKHLVVTGETLSVIAAQYETTWQRLFSKNTQLSNPDLLNSGDELIIPKGDEVIADRALPQVELASAPVQKTTTTTSPTRVSMGSVSGNTYSPGYCTWYVKNRRPDIPNGLGNASSWVSRAAAMGMATGSSPQAGAVGQRGNHVVYVESVNGDGTIVISDMNYQAVGVVTVRTVLASQFMYIY